MSLEGEEEERCYVMFPVSKTGQRVCTELQIAIGY